MRYEFTCPSCHGDLETRRPADPMDYIEGAHVRFGEVVSLCTNCGGKGWVEGTEDDIEDWGEPLAEAK